MSGRGWVGVDLDGTLAHYDGWKGPTHIGAPVPAMLGRVLQWLEDDTYDVKIFTARIAVEDETMRVIIAAAIQDWLEQHGLPRLEVTNVKDFAMVEVWDDRAVQVIPNTGEPVGQSTRGLT